MLYTFIPDIHGDPEGLEQTLIHAGLASEQSGRLVFGDADLHRPVFTGDYIDRGTANLKTLDLVMAVREHFQTVVELGNHELAALQALTHPENPRWMKEWMEGLPVLQEVAERLQIAPRAKQTTDAHPLANYTQDPDDPMTAKYLQSWQQSIEQHPEWQMIDFPKAFEKTKELFLHGEYSILFRQLEIAHVIDGILAIHAGITEKGLALGPDRLNALFQLALERNDFQFLYDFDWANRKPSPKAPLTDLTCMVKPMAPDTRPLISQKTAAQSLRQNMPVVIHGHAALGQAFEDKAGIQQCNNAFGVADMNGDIVMSRAHGAHTGSTWGYIQYDSETGLITANNPKTGPLDFGTLQGGEYVFPKQ